ncbi:MAG: hypothetical protein ACRELS_15275 [Candidatus Rokuibacteriota bacterium]
MSTQVIAPFGFFTYDAFRAGWFFLWRIGLYLLPAVVVNWLGTWMMIEPFLVSGVMQDPERLNPQLVMEIVTSESFVIGSILLALSSLGGFIASIPLTTKIARKWALRTWNRTFERGVWWSIFWRVFLTLLLAAIILMGALVVVGVVSATGATLVGGLLNLSLNCLLLVVLLFSYGWSMSRVVASRIGGVAAGVATTVVAGLNPLGYTPTAGPQYTAPPRPAPVTPMPTAPMSGAPRPVVTSTVMTPRAPMPPPPPSSSGGVAPAGRRQCPKCGLYETEKGTVLGWYCKVCGWSESRA